jgi:hypothetical protein
VDDWTGAALFGLVALALGVLSGIWLIALRRGAASWREAFRRREIQAFNAAVLVPGLAVVTLVAGVELLLPSSRGLLDQASWTLPLAMVSAFYLIRRPRGDADGS